MRFQSGFWCRVSEDLAPTLKEHENSIIQASRYFGVHMIIARKVFLWGLQAKIDNFLFFKSKNDRFKSKAEVAQGYRERICPEV